MPDINENDIQTGASSDVVDQSESAQAESAQKSKGGKKVKSTGSYIVGCKLPAGLTISHEGQSMTLAGTNDSLLINGFGITRDVPADLWEGFEKTFSDQLLIKNGIVFAVTDEKSAKDASDELKDQKTGLEQLDPNKQNTNPDKD